MCRVGLRSHPLKAFRRGDMPMSGCAPQSSFDPLLGSRRRHLIGLVANALRSRQRHTVSCGNLWYRTQSTRGGFTGTPTVSSLHSITGNTCLSCHQAFSKRPLSACEHAGNAMMWSRGVFESFLGYTPDFREPFSSTEIGLVKLVQPSRLPSHLHESHHQTITLAMIHNLPRHASWKESIRLASRRPP